MAQYNWGSFTKKIKLSLEEKRRFAIRRCKKCGNKIPFLSRKRDYCEKCRPNYPSDNYYGQKRVGRPKEK